MVVRRSRIAKQVLTIHDPRSTISGNMRLSEDRISNICHKIHDRLYLDELVDYTDEDEALKVIKKVFTEFLVLEDQMDNQVRHKISTLKKGIVEGSPEWEVLYRKYFEEEMRKKKL